MIEVLVLLAVSIIFFLRANERKRIEYWVVTLFTTGMGVYLTSVQSNVFFAISGVNYLLFFLSIVLMFIDIIDQGNFLISAKNKKFKKKDSGK